jgi:hypothetical protein
MATVQGTLLVSLYLIVGLQGTPKRRQLDFDFDDRFYQYARILNFHCSSTHFQLRFRLAFNVYSRHDEKLIYADGCHGVARKFK